MTRGPYKTKRKNAEPDMEQARRLLSDFRTFCDTAMKESPLQSTVAKLSLAETLAGLRVEFNILLKKQRDGTITIEELRCLPGIASNVRRHLEALGLTAQNDDAIDFGDL